MHASKCSEVSKYQARRHRNVKTSNYQNTEISKHRNIKTSKYHTTETSQHRNISVPLDASSGDISVQEYRYRSIVRFIVLFPPKPAMNLFIY